MGTQVLKYESGQTAYPFEEMTDSGDRTTFSASFAPWSRASSASLVVAPYGVKTGGAITPGSSNNTVDVAALTVVAPGMTGADANGEVSVAADTVSITRGVSSDTHNITSITVDATGSIVALSGTDGTAFSETRGADGGPPLIPVGSIEVGQVRTTSVTAAAVETAEIFQVIGQHQESTLQPSYDVDYVNGTITFNEALPAIHTGAVGKKVYVKGSTPIFATVPKASDWVPAESTYSISSTDTYDGAIGSSTAALGQASFNCILQDGVSDNILAVKGQSLWFKYQPDRDQSTPYQLTQGIFGVSRTFPAGGGSKTASCTVTPESESTDVTS
jgi:hypothetical protein